MATATPVTVPGDSVLCPSPRCLHPINSHVVDKGGCRARMNSGQTRCQCKRTPNDIALFLIGRAS